MVRTALLLILFTVVAEVLGTTLMSVPVKASNDCTPAYPKVALLETDRWELEPLKADGWIVTELNGTEILVKEFDFSSFAKAFTFMTDIALQCVNTCFYPAKWTNSFNKVEVTLYTSTEFGLSKNDLALGHFMDEEELIFAPSAHQKYDKVVNKVLKHFLGKQE